MANASDYNLTKISTKELSENLRATIEFGGNVFILAARGSGKTTIAKDVIRECGYREVMFNLSTKERCDFGYPNFFAAQSGKNNYINFMFPEVLRPLMEGNEQAVLVLDELDKSDPSVWGPLLELTQFHTLDGKLFPNLKAVVMTGNFSVESGQRPCLPLLDRAEKYLVEASHHHWLDWASKSGQIHPSITAFIADHPDELFGDVDPGDVYADPSPRGWHNASKLLNFGESKKWSHKILTNKVSGCVGKKTGIKYSSYFDHYQILLPIIEKIMKGEEVKGFGNLEQSKQMVSSMIVCSRLARMLDEMMEKHKGCKSEELQAFIPREADYVGNFLNNIDPEMSLISVRSQIGLERMLDSSLDENPKFDVILRSIAKRING